MAIIIIIILHSKCHKTPAPESCRRRFSRRSAKRQRKQGKIISVIALAPFSSLRVLIVNVFSSNNSAKAVDYLLSLRLEIFPLALVKRSYEIKPIF